MTKQPLIYLYSNQPIVCYQGRYYSKQKNFIDFLAHLATLADHYRLIVPCKAVTGCNQSQYTVIDIDESSVDIMKVLYYEGHVQALIASFLNALWVRYRLRSVINTQAVVMAGPGPNSFLFWLSVFSPRSVKFAFFIRGDTIESVRHLFKQSILCQPIIYLIKGFRARIRTLIQQKRAMVFVYGDQLKKQYQLETTINSVENTEKMSRNGHPLVHSIAPLIDSAMVRHDHRPDISDDGPLRVLYVGRLSNEKNIKALLDACVEAKKQSFHFELSIIGYGDLEKMIKCFIDDNNLSDRVFFKGYQAHDGAMAAIYDDHDVFCLPSMTEGIPRVIIEAFARLMPVMSTKVGSLPSLFPNEIRFIESPSSLDVLNTIHWCHCHRSIMSAMGRCGHQRINAFTIDDNAIKVDALLERYLLKNQIQDNECAKDPF